MNYKELYMREGWDGKKDEGWELWLSEGWDGNE